MDSGGNKMEHRTSLHNYILQDLRGRIVSEHIPPGSVLPSIPHLMRQYAAGRSTIRNVLASLGSDGLVQLEERRPAKVRGMPHDDTWRTRWERTVLCDRFAVLGSYFSMRRLLPAILLFGTRYCSAQALPRYAAAAGENYTCTDFTGLLEDILASTGPAVQRLLPPFLLHSALPYFWDISAAVRSSCTAVVRELGTHSPDEQRIAQALSAVCASVHCIVRGLADRSPELPRGLNSDSSWILFPEIEHQYTRIILDLLVRIGIGGRDRVGLLPSEENLSAHYRVSVSTVREALWRLESAGFTKTINGRGTVVMGWEPSAVSARSCGWLEKILLCALYASQLTALAMPSCALEAAERTTKEDLRALENTFHRSNLPIRALFHFVVHRQRLRQIRLILLRAGALCDFGLSLATAENPRELHDMLKAAAWELFTYLSQGQSKEFARALTDLYRSNVRSARDNLVVCHQSKEARAIHIP